VRSASCPEAHRWSQDFPLADHLSRTAAPVGRAGRGRPSAVPVTGLAVQGGVLMRGSSVVLRVPPCPRGRPGRLQPCAHRGHRGGADPRSYSRAVRRRHGPHGQYGLRHHRSRTPLEPEYPAEGGCLPVLRAAVPGHRARARQQGRCLARLQRMRPAARQPRLDAMNPGWLTGSSDAGTSRNPLVRPCERLFAWRRRRSGLVITRGSGQGFVSCVTGVRGR